MNSLFEVEGEKTKITITNQYILTSAESLIGSSDPDFLSNNIVNIQGCFIRQTRPRNWDIKGWIKLFKEIKKHLPEDDSSFVQGLFDGRN